MIWRKEFNQLKKIIKIAEEKYKYQQTLTNLLNEKNEEIKKAKESYKNFFLASEQQFKKFCPIRI